MARTKKERTPKSAERLKLIRDKAKKNDGTKGLSQAEFSQAIIEGAGLLGASSKEIADVSQQAISRYESNERPLEEKAAARVIAAFPDYRLDWLLGKDDFMTYLEKNNDVIRNARREGALLDGGFRLLAEVAGFSIEDSIMGDEIEDVVAHIEDGMLVSRGDLSARLNIDQLNRIENQVLDFAEFLLVKAIS